MKAILEFELPEDKEEFDAASKGMDWAILAWDIDQYIRNRLKYQTEKLDTLSAKKELEFLREALNEMLIDKGLQYPS
jgi:argonaute-like protein implicated in RNA metabolism and viral defense|tara:strand:+ start:319 stop:549 length:231 start_codon:yes stop_codon:yes gene_type:complete